MFLTSIKQTATEQLKQFLFLAANVRGQAKNVIVRITEGGDSALDADTLMSAYTSHVRMRKFINYIAGDSALVAKLVAKAKSEYGDTYDVVTEFQTIRGLLNTAITEAETLLSVMKAAGPLVDTSDTTSTTGRVVSTATSPEIDNYWVACQDLVNAIQDPETGFLPPIQ